MELVPDRRFGYEIAPNRNFKRYQAAVDLTPDPSGGTRTPADRPPRR